MIAIDQPRLYSDADLLKQLRSFCQVARSGSITRAAEHLGLSQPSVSQQVRLLETEFAATLFERNGPRITLTPAGTHLYRLAASLVAGMDRTPDTFAEEHAGILPSELHIAAGEVASIFILPPFLKQFRDEHPGTRLFVRSSAGRDGLAWLFDYEVEFMVGVMDIIPDTADFHPLLSCGSVLLVPLDHPLAGRESVEPSEAAAYPVIMSTRGTRIRQLADFIHGDSASTSMSWWRSTDGRPRSSTSRPVSGSPSSPSCASPAGSGYGGSPWIVTIRSVLTE